MAGNKRFGAAGPHDDEIKLGVTRCQGLKELVHVVVVVEGSPDEL